MPRLGWDAVGTRFYEAGVDRGVLYVAGQPGVVWNGLTSVNESPSGGDPRPYYIDGVKYLNLSAPEEFEATITAFTYPDEFEACDGSVQPRQGMFLTHQRRKSFGFSYRSMIGNDLGDNFGYKLHIVYNALASPTDRNHGSLKEQNDPDDFSWKITTKPPATEGYKRTGHIVIDSRTTDATVLSQIEDILYGTDSDSARIPTFDELISVYDTVSNMTVVDNGDGTFTVTASYDVIRMLDDETFEITSNNAVFIDDETYTLSSD
jgi:hypothetical protein